LASRRSRLSCVRHTLKAPTRFTLAACASSVAPVACAQDSLAVGIGMLIVFGFLPALPYVLLVLLIVTVVYSLIPRKVKPLEVSAAVVEQVVLRALEQFRSHGATTEQCPSCQAGVVVTPEPIQTSAVAIRVVIACECGKCSGMYDVSSQ